MQSNLPANLIPNKYEGTATVLTITAGAGSNTEGSYGEVIAATTGMWTCITISMASAGSAGSRFYVDIATGAGGAEVVIIPNILYDLGLGMGIFHFPIQIPAGTRVAARCADSFGGSNSVVLNVKGGYRG